MKNKETKKILPSKKSKVVSKKNQKSDKKLKSETSKKINYPTWTKPEHLNKKDHNDLKRFYELFTQKKFDVALNFASNLDTIVRDEIPSDIWKEIGGELTTKGKEELTKTEKEEVNPDSPSQDDNADKKAEPVEIKFKSEKELEQLVMENSKTFFGEQALLFKDKNEVLDDLFPDKFLIDFSSNGKPKLYLIDVVLAEQKIEQYFMKITHFFALLKNWNNQVSLICKLSEIINSNNLQKNELISKMPNDFEIPEFLSKLINSNPSVIFITNGEIKDISIFIETYTETWGRMLKTFVIRKFLNEGEESNQISPAFFDILKNKKSKAEAVKCTEEDHLREMPERIRNIYNEIKSALLETDNSLEFNPKKHYISVRKNKNLAFFHLRRKNIDLVIMNPEDDTKEQIKHYRIKSLPSSVQKFWNGACCTVVIENADHLSEVIDLLKMVVKKV